MCERYSWFKLGKWSTTIKIWPSFCNSRYVMVSPSSPGLGSPYNKTPLKHLAWWMVLAIPPGAFVGGVWACSIKVWLKDDGAHTFQLFSSISGLLLDIVCLNTKPSTTLRSGRLNCCTPLIGTLRSEIQGSTPFLRYRCPGWGVRYDVFRSFPVLNAEVVRLQLQRTSCQPTTQTLQGH